MVVSDYIFAANGNYQHGGAIGTSTTTSDFNYNYIHYKNYSFEGDGSYSIAGNRLMLRKKTSTNPETVQIRFEKSNRGGAGWTDRVYMLQKDAAGEFEVCYEKGR